MTTRFWFRKLFARPAARPIRKALVRCRPRLEALEDRLAPAILTVNSTADTANATDSYLSLREAVAIVNSATLPSGLSSQITGQISGELHGGGTDTIVFDHAAVTGAITLGGTQLELSLPSTTATITIDGGAAGITVDANHASRVLEIDAGATVSLSGLTLANGSAFDGGGLNNGGMLMVSNSTFSGNSASDAGGGLYNDGTGTLTVSNSTFSANLAQGVGGGGGLENWGTLTVSNSTFAANSTSNSGGGLYNAGTLMVSNCTLSGNSAQNVGGGLFNGGTLTVNASTLSGNSSLSYGGGIANLRDSTLTLSNSTLSGNSAGEGGGIANYGTLTLTNSTLSGNSASVFGGGIGNGGTLTVRNSTLSGNSAPRLAGGIENLSGTLTVSNSIVANSPGGDIGGTYTGSHNLTGTVALGPLADNGGPTQTCALLPGSPAIDAGTSTGAPATDQRGISRPQGAAVDIGAFESRGFTLSITGGNDQQAFANTAFASPLAVQVTSAFGEPVQGGQVTFSAPASGASATFAPATTVTIDANGQASLSAVANGITGGYTVSAATGSAGPVNFSLTNVAPVSLPASLPGGTYGSAYKQTLTATGGMGGPYTFTVTVGSPPPGLTLASNGVLAGTPTAAGSFTFTVQVSDTGDFTGTQSYTVAINPATLSATGVSINATAGAPFSGAVATFTNADPFGGAASYSALIAWGDGSTSAGVIAGTGSTLTISGTHTYAAPGSEPVSVQISHNLGDTTTATTSSTAMVTSLDKGVPPCRADCTGFWHDWFGQSLLKGLNGGPAATALSAWLATTFPNLYGTSAGANNLTGKSNAQVAAFYQAQFAVGGLGAEVLATALDVYASTASLGGNAAAAVYFPVSATGLGADSVWIGRDGAAFGVANDTILNVYQLLQAVNQRAVNGVPYSGNPALGQQASEALARILESGALDD
jgi:hypothetical protein